MPRKTKEYTAIARFRSADEWNAMDPGMRRLLEVQEAKAFDRLMEEMIKRFRKG